MEVHSGRLLVSGSARGEILYTDTPISFWGGVNTTTGEVIDKYHPLQGTNIKNRILVIPGSRGSCSGSGGILELLYQGCGPAALVFSHLELLVTLGVWIAQAMFERSIPVIVLDPSTHALLRRKGAVIITQSSLQTMDNSFQILLSPLPSSTTTFALGQQDHDMLSGKRGEAAKLSMEILILYAKAQGADSLIDVTQAHIDACIYVGGSTLVLPEKLLDLGAKVTVPSTMNALSVDRRRWKELGSDPVISNNAAKVADAYLRMGASISFTCAPYLLEAAPKADEQIGWAESNAVVFANSVLGAKTQKYPDYLDVFIAITGRAPNADCHTENGRIPTLCVEFPEVDAVDDALYPLLGYCIGQVAGAEIPLVLGLENKSPTLADLKAFGAAFATTSAAPMFHISGVTPEAYKGAKNLPSLKHSLVTLADLRLCWERLNTPVDPSVAVVSLGNPHFAFEEFASLARLAGGRKRNPKTHMIVTCGREIYERAANAGFIATLEDFGAILITDTCWCMIEEPIIPVDAQNIMTNSAKYAHYGPGMTKRGFHFGSLSACVDAAECGYTEGVMPEWLSQGDMVALKSRDTQIK